VLALGSDTPLFGVCMGHQCIGQACGGRVVRAPGGVMHGKASPVQTARTAAAAAAANAKGGGSGGESS
jgi:anthranilate/para-aminobenzoate synthase component II